MKSREQKEAENIADVLANGPGLRYTRNTWIIAKSEDGKMVFRGGLGGMGIGEMWCQVYEEDFTDPEYINAPVHQFIYQKLADLFELGPKKEQK